MALAGGVTILLALVSCRSAASRSASSGSATRCACRGAPRGGQSGAIPADGIVVEVTDAEAEPPAGTSVGPGQDHHPHRACRRASPACPVAGRVTDNFLIPGLFRSTADTALRRDNERREITIEGEDGNMYLLVQIGLTARQLVCRHGPQVWLPARRSACRASAA